MAATIADLGVRVLRRLGVAVVPAAERPALSVTVPVTDVATRALESLGIIAPSTIRPALGTFSTVAFPAIALRALQWLGVVASDETPLASDQTLAEVKAASVHDELLARGMALWAYTAIPQPVVEDYVMLTAMQLAASFGKTVDAAQKPILEERVRSVSMIFRAQGTAEAKVLSVHDALVSQGAVGWASTAIPQAVAEEYSMMTQIYLAPEFGQKADMGALPAMEARVRRFSMVARGPALAEQKVLAVHAGLDARGKARWTVFDIPTYIEEPYVVLAANLLAPEFALPVDQAAGLQAQRELAQVISLPSAGGPVVAQYF